MNWQKAAPHFLAVCVVVALLAGLATRVDGRGAASEIPR